MKNASVAATFSQNRASASSESRWPTAPVYCEIAPGRITHPSEHAARDAAQDRRGTWTGAKTWRWPIALDLAAVTVLLRSIYGRGRSPACAVRRVDPEDPC